jgi:hypothetical protein
MRSSRLNVILLTGFLGLIGAGPAMAWDYFSVGVSFGVPRHCDPPVVVRERVYEPRVVVASAPVVVERPCYPVFVPRSRVEVRYVAPSRYRASYSFARPHGERMVVRDRHHD